MSTKGVSSSDILSWVEKTVEREDLSECKTTLMGKSEKGDGYMGDIVFAHVTGTMKNNGKKTFDLVIKHGKSNSYLRKVTPMRAAFETEIYVYNNVLPAFTAFQKEKNIPDMFLSFPRCYKTLLFDDMEVLVLKNMKKAGFELHDKMKPLNVDHIKKVVTEYGKYHALSFALRDQQPEKFASLNARRVDVLHEFMQDKSMRETMKKAADGVQEMLKEENELVLLEKFRRKLTKEPLDIILDLVTEEKSQVVISHGDCWNNNFLFKYEGDDRSAPSRVAFLDFQLSYLRSPVYDLAYFLYSTCTINELNRFEEIMEVYYTSLSRFLKKLGSDPETLFSFSDLKRHWRKYSFFGVLFIQSMLKFVFCSEDNTPAMEDLREGESIGKIAEVHLESTYKDLYNERVKSVLTHHFECNF